MKDLNSRELQLGDFVYIPSYRFFKHCGVVVQEGCSWSEPIIRTVLRSENTPINQTQSEFSNGEKISILLYPGQMPRWEVAKSALDVVDFDYDLVTNNCEHFCRRAHGQSDTSLQVKVAVALLVAGLAVTLIARRPVFAA